MSLPDHTSASQMTTYAACPRKYELKYLEGAEPEFTPVSLALGSVVHSATEWYFEQKRDGHEPTPADTAAIVRADLAAAFEAYVELGKWTRPDLETHAQRLVHTLVEELGDLSVRDTEVPFDLVLHDPRTGEALPRPLLGFLDLVVEGGLILELKTARSDYTAVQVATSLQLNAYLHALAELDLGHTLGLVVLVKTRNPRVQRLELRPDHGGRRWFLEAATRIERGIQAGHFPPSPGWACSGCEFRRRCLGSLGAEVMQAA